MDADTLLQFYILSFVFYLQSPGVRRPCELQFDISVGVTSAGLAAAICVRGGAGWPAVESWQR